MNEVSNLLRARIECIWIQTYEEEEVVKDITELVRTEIKYLPNATLRMWSNTEGLKTLPLHAREEVKPADPKVKEIPALFHVLAQVSEKDKGSSNVFILRDLHSLIKEPKTMRYIRDFKEFPYAHFNPLIVVSPYCEIPDDISKLFRVVEYGLPSREDVRKLVKAANNRILAVVEKTPKDQKCPYTALDAEGVERITNACMGLTAKEIKMMLNESTIKNKEISLDLVLENKIQAVKKTGVLDFKMPTYTLDDIGGNHTLKEWLYEVRDAFSPEARAFGLDMPKGYMSVGIPGCSKSMSAEAFAGMMNWPLLSLSMSKVMSKMVGESEKKIAQALDVAKACAPCVLLLDEVEKMLGGISSSNNTDSGITARVFQTLLKFMNDDDNGVYVIMTSNDVSQLPPEFTRSGRLDATWYFGLPSDEERREIFKIHFAHTHKAVSDVMLDAAIAHSNNFTGAEIQQVVRNCMRKAFSRSRTDGNDNITKEDIIAAAEEVTPVYESSREKIVALETYCNNRARRTAEIPEQDNSDAMDRDFRHSLEI
jgi:SpoVK/Ycf46/Vps4 family AAA+-type ATPase